MPYARSVSRWLAALLVAFLLTAAGAVAAVFAGATAATAASCSTTALVAVNTSDGGLYRWVRPTPTSGAFAARAQVGNGWSGNTLIASDSASGDLFAIDTYGNLRLYAFNGAGYSGGSIIYNTWFRNTKFLVAGGNGVLYAVQDNGNLVWWRWLPAGSRWTADRYVSYAAGWAPGSGSTIGTGWNFTKVFGGGNGVLYAVASNGDLLWYRHQTPGMGVSSWLGPRTVGAGWGALKQIAGVDGVIYATTASGALLVYNHLGVENGTSSWSSDSGSEVGSGWSTYNRLTVNPKACTPTPARFDRVDIPLYLVHGIDLSIANDPGSNCAGTWGSALSRLRALGWTGPIRTVGYYNNDVNCDDMIDHTNLDRSLDVLGASLAWDLYNGYSNFGRPVDVIAHSMGGMILRAAVTGVAKGDARFPPYLYLQNAITLDSPHQGVIGSGLCALLTHAQCIDLAPASGFLGWLDDPNPQSTMGTDWTIVGSANDNFVPWPTAVAVDSGRGSMSPGHRVIYKNGLDHSEMNSTVGSSGFLVNHWNYHGQMLLSGDQTVTGDLLNWPHLTGYLNGNAPGPIDWAYNAARYWSLW